MPPACILFADDEPEIRGMVKLVLEKAGFQVLMAENGSQALKLFTENEVDLVLLDMMMPVMDGYETCRHIRDISEVPVIFLTVRAEEEDLVKGFAVGAHDYVAKPFRPRELVARIQAALQRSSVRQAGAQRINSRLLFEDLELDLKTHEVFKNGAPIPVTAMGYHLLEYFMLHRGQVVSKIDLMREVWGTLSQTGNDNMIEAAIKRLRKDLGDDSREPRYIKTIWGVGYRFGDSKER